MNPKSQEPSPATFAGPDGSAFMAGDRVRLKRPRAKVNRNREIKETGTVIWAVGPIVNVKFDGSVQKYGIKMHQSNLVKEPGTAGTIGPEDQGTPPETQSKLADIGFASARDETNKPRLILEAFKLGVIEGRRQAKYPPNNTLCDTGNKE